MSTKIEWVKNQDGTQGKTWNVVTGCTKVSPGCKNCYAERMARRLAGRAGYPEAPHHFDVALRPDRLEQPLKRRKPTTYFVPSMGDLFHEDVPFWFIWEVWKKMRNCPQHTFQVLTKRSERMAADVLMFYCKGERPLPNVWLGTSIESPEYSYRSHYLRETPAAIRFISFEPLLASFADCPGVFDDMDWCIVGGESGPGARPMDPEWARGIRDQCIAAGVPYFHKQNGEYVPADGWNQWGTSLNGKFVDPKLVRAIRDIPGDIPRHMVRVGKKAAGRLLDGREWNQMPINKKVIEQ